MTEENGDYDFLGFTLARMPREFLPEPDMVLVPLIGGEQAIWCRVIRTRSRSEVGRDTPGARLTVDDDGNQTYWVWETHIDYRPAYARDLPFLTKLT